MRIAVIGPYGLPPLYGGIERHSAEIYSRLVKMGHEVTLYSRSSYSDFRGDYRGIHVIRVPVLHAKGWETVFYSPMATVHALATGRFDVFHYHSLPSATHSWIPRIFGKRVACTIHSIDWKHPRWGPLARLLLQFSETAAVTFPHVTIAVSETVRNDILRRHPGKSIVVIPNGVEPAQGPEPVEPLRGMGLEPRKYLLYVGRLVSEKGAHILVDAARHWPSLTVAIVGGSRYSDDYIDVLKDIAGPNVKFLGYRYDEELAALFSQSLAVVVPSLEEGFSLTVIEAMSYGRPVIASDIPALRERLGDRGFYFERSSPDSLAAAITTVIENREAAERLGAQGREIAIRDYGWDRIASMTLDALEGRVKAGLDGAV